MGARRVGHHGNELQGHTRASDTPCQQTAAEKCQATLARPGQGSCALDVQVQYSRTPFVTLASFGTI
jgi:hypothetical protein